MVIGKILDNQIKTDGRTNNHHTLLVMPEHNINIVITSKLYINTISIKVMGFYVCKTA